MNLNTSFNINAACWLLKLEPRKYTEVDMKSKYDILFSAFSRGFSGNFLAFITTSHGKHGIALKAKEVYCLINKLCSVFFSGFSGNLLAFFVTSHGTYKSVQKVKESNYLFFNYIPCFSVDSVAMY